MSYYGSLVYKIIVEFKREHDGISPTVREIMTHAGINGYQTVVDALDELEEAGRIRKLKNLSRGIMVNGGRWSVNQERKNNG